MLTLASLSPAGPGTSPVDGLDMQNSMNEEVVHVDSNGRCFLCLVNLGSLHKDKSLSVSRYLKPDVKKVLQQNGGGSLNLISEPLVTMNLEGYHHHHPQLKVTLCQECSSVNDTFFRLYRQLQQIEREVRSCLNVIYEKMAIAEAEGGPRRAPDSELEPSSSMEKEEDGFQFVNGMRKEVMEKCSLKLLQLDPAPDKLIEGNDMVEEGGAYPDCEIEIVMDHDEASMEPEVVDVGDNEAAKTRSHVIPDVIDIAEDEEQGEEGDPTTVKILFPETARKYQKRPFTIDPITRLYRCNLCSEQFEKYHPFWLHHKSYHIREKFKCVPCGAEFLNRNAYKSHHQGTHMDLRFKCPNPKCTKTYEDKNGLSIHQQRSGCGDEAGPSPGVKTQKVFECPHCQKHFSRSTTLREHIRIHTGEKPYKCDYCDKAFCASSALKCHLDRHRDIRHFQCPECKQTFPEKCKLTAHKQRTGHR